MKRNFRIEALAYLVTWEGGEILFTKRPDNIYIDTNLPTGTNVSKSGPETKTTIQTVYRDHLRRRNQIKGDFPLAFHFVCGPRSPWGSTKKESKRKAKATKNDRNWQLCRQEHKYPAPVPWNERNTLECRFLVQWIWFQKIRIPRLLLGRLHGEGGDSRADSE